MTEDEAKTKWCPFARQTDRGFGSFNRVRYPVTDASGIPQKTKEGWPVMSEAQPAGGCHCIGSKCMAWRVLEKAQPAQNEVKFVEWWEGDEKPQTPPEEDGWRLTEKGQDDPDECDDKTYLWEEYSKEKKPATQETGCCGLAGKP